MSHFGWECISLFSTHAKCEICPKLNSLSSLWFGFIWRCICCCHYWEPQILTQVSVVAKTKAIIHVKDESSKSRIMIIALKSIGSFEIVWLEKVSQDLCLKHAMLEAHQHGTSNKRYVGLHEICTKLAKFDIQRCIASPNFFGPKDNMSWIWHLVSIMDYNNDNLIT